MFDILIFCVLYCLVMDIISRKKCAAILSLLIISIAIKKRHKKRKLWMQSWLKRRYLGKGVLNMIEKELSLEDKSNYNNYLRMGKVAFNQLLNIVGPKIRKQNSILRESIAPEHR